MNCANPCQSIEWGLWQVCCRSDAGTDCVYYTDKSGLQSSCQISVPSSELATIHGAQALQLRSHRPTYCAQACGFLAGVALMASCIVNSYAAFQVRPRCRAPARSRCKVSRLKLAAFICNLAAFVLSLSSFGTFSSLAHRNFFTAGLASSAVDAALQGH